MDKQQARKLLDVSDIATASEIEGAFQAKSTQLKEKINSAPTDVLKEKLSAMDEALKTAYQLLIAIHQKPVKNASPLTKSKLFDIPGVGLQDVEQISLEKGTILLDRYEIKAFIANGGMGAVYRAYDKNRDEDIAIKVMLPHLVENDNAKTRFLDEARLSSQLSHPNIVNVFDVQQTGDLCFITMELLEGQDLRDLIEARKAVRQAFTLDEALEIITPLCEALDYAHDITVHRDIKPENIFLTEEGKYKLMDFGLARVMNAKQRSSSGVASGTAYYMAPEQLKGAKDIDSRADQYALGVLVYELLSGEVPAGAIEPLHKVSKSISKKVSDAVQKSLSPKPENRFQSLSEFLAALQATGMSMPSIPVKGLGIAAAVIVVALLVGGLASSGGLNNVWDALKPIDKELIAKQKAEVAKLQGEIKNYQRRLENGRRQLESDLRDAARNNDNNEKYLKHWKKVTDNYLFEGDSITELEGELSMGESLLREESVDQAKTTLVTVRDGYKGLWEQFSEAEDLLKTEERTQVAYQRWIKRKKKYDLSDPVEVKQASQKETDAEATQSEGDFKMSVSHWVDAENYWNDAYQTTAGQVSIIEQQRVENEAERYRAAKAESNRNKIQRISELKAQVKVTKKDIDKAVKDINSKFDREWAISGNERTKIFKRIYSEMLAFEDDQLIVVAWTKVVQTKRYGGDGSVYKEEVSIENCNVFYPYQRVSTMKPPHNPYINDLGVHAPSYEGAKIEDCKYTFNDVIKEKSEFLVGFKIHSVSEYKRSWNALINAVQEYEEVLSELDRLQ